MKSLLVDTGPLVALCRPNDQFHARAMSELTRLGRGPKLVCLPVLTETYFFLSVAVQRKRLWALIEEEIVRPFTERGEVLVNERALRWLQKYDDHNPDFADAYILSLSSLTDFPIWTFDTEFRSIWKTHAGKKPKLVLS